MDQTWCRYLQTLLTRSCAHYVSVKALNNKVPIQPERTFPLGLYRAVTLVKSCRLNLNVHYDVTNAGL